MSKLRLAGVVAALVFAGVAGVWAVEAQMRPGMPPNAAPADEETPTPRLKRFDLKGLDGVSVALTDDLFGGVENPERICFVFTNPWSSVAALQTRDALLFAPEFKGQVVVVCAGDEREVLGTASRFDPLVEGKRKALWLRSATSVHTDFGPLFEPDYGINQLKQVPALLVVDSTRKAIHKSIGEMTQDDVAEAMSKTGDE